MGEKKEMLCSVCSALVRAFPGLGSSQPVVEAGAGAVTSWNTPSGAPSWAAGTRCSSLTLEEVHLRTEIET